MKYRAFPILLDDFSLFNSKFEKDRLPSLQDVRAVSSLS